MTHVVPNSASYSPFSVTDLVCLAAILVSGILSV